MTPTRHFRSAKALLAGSALAVLAACAGGGSGGGFGFGQAGCQTIWVYQPASDGGVGGVKPVSNCGGSAPRDTLRTQMAQVQAAPTAPGSAETLTKPDDGGTPPSAAAEKTRPAFAPAAYNGPNDMVENADMAAFMGRVRADYKENKNPGAWGYAAIDALAAGDTAMAQDIIDAMASKPAPPQMSASHLRPWVLAAAGRKESATRAADGFRALYPAWLVRAHRALLAEGMGDIEGALAEYAKGPKTFEPIDPSKMRDAGELIAANGERVIAARYAELLRTAGKDVEARALLQLLIDSDEDNAYFKTRLEMLDKKTDKAPARTLNQAMALSLSDDAALYGQWQSFMGMLTGGGRGQREEFNPLVSSIRQSALLLDPNNGDMRLGEVVALFDAGKFEPSMRLAQIGDPPARVKAAIYSVAGRSALELGSEAALTDFIDRSLQLDNRPAARLTAANTLAEAGQTDRAIKVIDEAMRAQLTQDERIAALLTKGQAYFQHGEPAKAAEQARAARALDDSEQTRQFLASMLVRTPQREEGLNIMRDMLKEQPDNTGLMNNLGYSLIDGYVADAELDEGFKLLKEASRLTPDEANLLDSVGWAYYLYGDFKEAKRYIGLAIKAFEPFNNWELFDHMGDVDWRLGDQAEAKKNWQKAMDSRPPFNERPAIQAKLKDGLVSPAPVRKDTPEVPLPRNRGKSEEI